MEKKKIVFLYSELAGYFISCIKKLSLQDSLEIHVIHWPVNKEAPFDFQVSSVINMYNRDKYTDDKLQKLIGTIQPAIIYCSGWMDKGYLKICRKYKGKIPVIAGFDNQWKATLKQWLAVVVSPFKIRNHFSHCWVPGELQVEYARRLGFSARNILTGFYTCDFDFFHAQYLTTQIDKEKKFPKRFIYVGRYVAHKGVQDLWKAFMDLQEKQPNEWELWCLGTGNVEPVQHPKIKHFGFIQPENIGHFIQNTGVFVLPSHFEPWGVVVHEFAAAGFRIICSDQVGAKTNCVENKLNGYIYASGNITELKSAMMTIINSDEKKLNAMSLESVKKANLITPETWVKQLMSLL